MGKVKERQKGDKYRPNVDVLKSKKGVPTRIKINGNEYILQHPDQYRGNRG